MGVSCVIDQNVNTTRSPSVCVYTRVQENFSKGGRAGIFDLYPVVLYLFVRCFLISFGDRFGRVSRGTLPILTTMHAVLIKLHHEYVLLRRFFFYFDWELCSIYPSQGYIERPGTAQLL